MGWVIYAILAVTLLAIVFALVVFMKAARRNGANGGAYDVFEITGTRLTVLAGIPVTFDIDEIANITFSARKAPRSASAYNGIMRVVKKDGKKSRPFLFDSSAYRKKMVLISSRQDIKQTIEYLMAELKQHHIPCSRVM